MEATWEAATTDTDPLAAFHRDAHEFRDRWKSELHELRNRHRDEMHQLRDRLRDEARGRRG